MKLWLLPIIGILWISTAGAIAQGTVNFANVAGPATARTVDAPIFASQTIRAAGSEYMAQLYAGPSASALEAVGPATPFLTGAGAGYFTDGNRSIPTIAPGAAATIVVRAWQVATGATWEEATIKGQSAPITVTTGGSGSPPTLPANLTGLQTFTFIIPEPSTLYFASVGLLLLFFKRRCR